MCLVGHNKERVDEVHVQAYFYVHSYFWVWLWL